MSVWAGLGWVGLVCFFSCYRCPQADVLQFLAKDGLLDSGLRIRPMTLPDRFVAHGTPEGMYEDAGLTSKDIVNTALATLGSNSAMADLRA